uniref:AMY-1-associating protein expressed in testis 1 n=1 Tax=Lygus hesperus TaxID=30085 RepID=A0A0A9X9Q9_LYGHE
MKLIGLVALVQQEMLGEGIADLALKSHLEVERMTEETRRYLMALLGERTRWHREAAEAGRRQRELRRRDLYNEFFRHLTRRNEITSSFYLKIIEDKVIRAIAEKEADVSTRQKADEIEKKDTEDAMRKKHDIVMRREMMARLLHDFYIPQIAKNLERYSIDYYIGKARKTAIEVITERAQPYNTALRETSLMELVKHLKGKIYAPATPPPATPESESTEPLAFHDDEDDDDEDEELAKKIEFLDQFMKQETMSVISDAETLSKEAERYKNVIMKKLQLRKRKEENL